MSIKDKTRLESAIDSVLLDSESPEHSIKTSSHLAQLATVWVSAYLESTCRRVMLDYTRRRADKSIVNYVSHTLRHFGNPRMGKMLDLLGAVNQDAADQLRTFAEGQIEASIRSIVSNRNNIAHGRSTQITMVQIKVYYTDARRLVRKMEELFD